MARVGKFVNKIIKSSVGRTTVTTEEFFFFAFFILLSVTKGLGLYEGQKLFLLLVVPAYLCGLVKLLITSYTKRQWAMQMIFLLLAAVVYYKSREQGILFLAFLVLGMKNISVKKVIHAGLWVWSVCAVALSIFSFFRLEHTVYRVHDKMGLGHIFRWSLGFTHPNILHITYLALCAFLLYELGERFKFRHFCYLMFGNALVFLYSVSYTGFGIVALLLIAYLYGKIRPRFWFFENLAVNSVLPIILILSFYIPMHLLEGPLNGYYQKLNFMLNTRLYLARQFLIPEYMSLFGVNLSKVVNSTMTMDNSYVWGFINYGGVAFCLLMLGYFVLIAYDTYKQRTKELVILVCFLAAGWTEPFLWNTSFKNLTLIFLGSLLFLQKEGTKEYCLFQGLPKQVAVPFVGLPDEILGKVKTVWKMQKKKLLLLSVVGMFVGAALCAAFYRESAGYVVPRFYTDALDKNFVFLESKEDEDYSGYRVMNYRDGETPMQVIEGKAVQLETVRYYVGSMMIGGLFSVAAWTFCLLFQERKAGEDRKKEKAAQKWGLE